MTVLKTSMRNFLAHKGRMALSAVAVLLSVAFVCGTLVFTDTMNTTFDKLFAATASDVTVSPKSADDKQDDASRTGKPDALPASAGRADRARRPACGKAEGGVGSPSVTVVNGKNENMGASTGAPTIAGNWTDNDLKAMEITSGRAPRGPTEMMIDADTADKHHLKIGDALRTIAVTGDFTAKITGIATFKVTNPGAAIVYFDTATAQRELLGGTGKFTADQRDRRERGQRRAAQAGRGGRARRGHVQAPDGEGSRRRQPFQRRLVPGRHEVRDARLRRDRPPRRHLPDHQHVLDAGRPAHPGDRPDARHRLQPQQVNRSVLVEALLLGVFGSVLGVARGRRSGRRPDEADGLHGDGAVHQRPHRQVDDAR